MSNMIPFGQACELQNGKAFKPSDWVNEGTPIVRIQNLNDETKPFNYCNTDVEERFHIDSGDLLFSWSGTPGTSFGAFFWNRGKAYLNQHIFKVTVDSDVVDKNYLRYAINSKLIQIIDQAHGGVGLKHITKGKLEAIEIPLPPLPEQKRIAAILDKADAIRRKRQQAIDLADEFLRSVFLEMFGDPVTNPNGWKIKSLKEISQIQIGPFGTQLHKEDYIEDGIPLINPTHIKNGKIIPKSSLSISSDKHLELPEYHLKLGDIVMGRRGEMGRCAIVTEVEDGWMCGTGSLFLRPNDTGIFSEYLQKFLSSNAIKAHLESESQGATMPNLNKTIVGNIVVPVPNKSTLIQFARVKKKIIGMKELTKDFSATYLFDSLAQQAFAGKL